MHLSALTLGLSRRAFSAGFPSERLRQFLGAHERPSERFERERAHPVPTASQAPFRLGIRLARRVAEDYLVSLDTNRYSVAPSSARPWRSSAAKRRCGSTTVAPW
jgi:hypothetical protein